MTLASLWNVPRSREFFAWFAFSNQAHHAAIADETLRQLTVTLTQFPLDPMPLDLSSGDWLYNHQTMHDQQNAVLGITGNDLTQVNFRDISQLTNWIQLHAEEHRQAATILGI